MVELSAKHSPFVKRLLPFVVVLLVTVWTYWSRLLASKPVSLLTVGFTLIALSTILVFVLRRVLWSRADTVQDLGDQIRVTRWRHTVQLLLQDISRVRIDGWPYCHARISAPACWARKLPSSQLRREGCPPLIAICSP
jgi:hypothetical protein